VTTDSATTESVKTITEQVLDWLAAHPCVDVKEEPGLTQPCFEIEHTNGKKKFLPPFPDVVLVSTALLDIGEELAGITWHDGILAMQDDYGCTLRWRPLHRQDYGPEAILFQGISDEADDDAGDRAAETTATPQVTAPTGDVSIH